MLFKIFIAVQDYTARISKSNFSCFVVLYRHVIHLISYRIKNYFIKFFKQKDFFSLLANILL